MIWTSGRSPGGAGASCLVQAYNNTYSSRPLFHWMRMAQQRTIWIGVFVVLKSSRDTSRGRGMEIQGRPGLRPLFVVTAITAAFTGPAIAQEGAAEGKSADMLEEVVVTGL